MNDCANADIRDQLPDLLHDHLDRDARAAVEAHLATCDDCRAELEMLRDLRAAAVTPRVDTARIAAAVTAPARLRWNAGGWSAWRMAAAIAIMVIGGTSIAKVIERGGIGGFYANSARDTAGISRPELQLGDAYADLTDAQLTALLSEIPKLDGLPVSEPDVIVPMSPLPGRGGTE